MAGAEWESEATSCATSATRKRALLEVFGGRKSLCFVVETAAAVARHAKCHKVIAVLGVAKSNLAFLSCQLLNAAAHVACTHTCVEVSPGAPGKVPEKRRGTRYGDAIVSSRSTHTGRLRRRRPPEPRPTSSSALAVGHCPNNSRLLATK